MRKAPALGQEGQNAKSPDFYQRDALRQESTQLTLLKQLLPPASFPHAFTFHTGPPLKAYIPFPLSCHFSKHVLFFVKMLYKPQGLTTLSVTHH